MKLTRILILSCLAAMAAGCSPKYQIGDYYDKDGKIGIVFNLTEYSILPTEGVTARYSL